MSALQGSGALPRELVLASAGSGKTYHLSSRILGLLAAGAEPGEILASTFTRKAAGEILERVLLRLAKGASDLEEAQRLGVDAHARLADPEECRRLLAALLQRLHQVNVGTLDAFFGRMARLYFQELGLSPGWTIADTPTQERLRTEAVVSVLAGEEPKRIAERLRLLNLGSAKRLAHEDLWRRHDELLRLRREADPAAPDVWRADFEVDGSEDPQDIEREAAALAKRMRALSVPETKGGTPAARWVRAQETAAACLERGEWGKLFDGGIGAKIAEGAGKFDKHSVDEAWTAVFEEARRLGRRALAGRYRRQVEAMGELARSLEDAFQTAQRRVGAYRFEDITHLLADPGAVGSREDLHYRLDQQVRHLLLDEFQDTSLEQWEALEPLAGELLSGHLEERAAVIVADPKQSIYGWRGARPELVHGVARRYELAEETLERSWRSGPVILDFVALVFGGMARNAILRELDPRGVVAAGWLGDFAELAPARAEQPGHVRIHVGAATRGRGAVQPQILHDAARVVRDLHKAIPERSIGVLVRQNRVVAHLMAELAEMGVAASGEGGSPLTDTAPVNAILSLLHLADHPGDTVARYHVATTPLGAALGCDDWRDDAALRRLSEHVRRTLARDGYGPALAGWVAAVASSCDRHEVLRLLQLVDLGHRWDERSTLRTRDFLRYVSTEVVEDPSAARVQVMTVHKAKGLEFDVVVLPELYSSMDESPEGLALPVYDSETGRISKVYPRLSKGLLPYFPEVAEAQTQARERALRDELSVLYVALTRARYALHLIVPQAGGGAKNPARLIRDALGLADAQEDSGILLERGDPEWHRKVPVETRGARPEPAKARPRPTGPLLEPPRSGPTRNLPRRAPSSLEGGGRVDLVHFLDLENVRALDRGEVVHAWCEAFVWAEDGLPGEAELIAGARRISPRMPAHETAALARAFRGWMEQAPIRAALSRSAYPADPGTRVRVETERPFLRRKGDEIQEGSVDRLVLVERAGRVVEVHVLDFKTDAIAPDDEAALEARAEHYRPQIEAYCVVMREEYGLEAGAVRGTLLFLVPGRVVDLA